MKFSLDTPIFDKTNQIADILGAGFLWLLCSVPVITIGPATAALYYTIVKVVRRNRETVIKSFFHSFKSNLKQGILFTIFYLLYGAAIGFYILAALEGRIQMNPYGICTFGIILACPFFIYLDVYISCAVPVSGWCAAAVSICASYVSQAFPQYGFVDAASGSYRAVDLFCAISDGDPAGVLCLSGIFFY